MGTVLPFALFFIGVNFIRSTRASITATLEPISAGFFAYFFLGEVLEPLQLVGGAMVVLSAYTATATIRPVMSIPRSPVRIATTRPASVTGAISP